MSQTSHRFAQIVACATFVLLFAGGLVTSTGSSLAVPDWPLSYGQLFPPMVGGILYEHGHRMIAGAVALSTVALAVCLQRSEPRRWVRRLGWLAVGAVLLQALLGGLTVLLLLPTAISVSHAGLAMIFFALVSSLALFTSPGWSRPAARGVPLASNAPAALAALATAATYLQILLGAWMRHTGSALAIPTFPLAFGRLIPPMVSFGVQIHFAHRLGALIVGALVLGLAAAIVARHRTEPRLMRPAALLVALLVAQVTLGAFTIWTARAVVPTTIHVVTGALMLVVTLRIAQWSWRLRAGLRAPAAAPSRLAPSDAARAWGA